MIGSVSTTKRRTRSQTKMPPFSLRSWPVLRGDIVATIPVPLVFAKGEFENGMAAKRLNEFGADPYPYLDEAAKKKMAAAQSDLLRKFTELTFDESAQACWQESQRRGVDNIDGVPVTETDLQNDLFETAANPF